MPQRQDSGRRPRADRAGFRHEPLSIGRAVAGLMARFGYDREQSASRLETAWSEAVPESLRSRSRAGLVRQGVLEVIVTHSALVQEMGFQKRDLVARLQSLLPEEGITDIRCRVGTLS